MQLIIFILVYPLIWILSILPLQLLFIFSDVIYFLLYYVFGYRKNVVRNNLRLAFPEKTKDERLEIEKKSFKHFVDIFMLMIKSFTISEKEVLRRMHLTNPEVLEKVVKNGKGLVMLTGHYANWEWTIHLIRPFLPFDLFAAYKKINNKYFDRAQIKSRNKFGSHLILNKDFYKLIYTNKKEGKLGLYGLISDQSPLLDHKVHWGNFMGLRVPLITGPELLAKRFDLTYTYLHTKRLKRGYYESTLEVLSENPNDFANYELTNLYFQELEKQIRKAPEFYFWTHKRFKHMGKEDLIKK